MSNSDSPAPLPREVLPIPDRKPVGLTTYDAKDPDTKYPPIVPLRPPTGAPNVLVILIDPVSFQIYYNKPMRRARLEVLGFRVAHDAC